MGDLQQIKQRFVVVLAVLAVIDLVLLVYLLWPGSSSLAQQAQLETVQQKNTNLTRDVALWHSSDPEKTRADLKRLYGDNIPTRWSQISQEMDKLIQETGVTALSIRYPVDTVEKRSLPDVQQVKIETTVTGDYPKVAKFINAMEQDKLLFIVDKISLSGQEGGTVSLQIIVDTFLKEPGGPGPSR